MAGRLPLFDVHCHLQDPRILQRAPSLLRSAADAGVQWVVVNGTSETDWECVKQMGEVHASVIPCFGLHPWWVGQRSPDWYSKLRSMLESVPSAAVGEVGLDQSSRGSAIDDCSQVDVLRQQLDLARELRRPAAIHCVRAFGSLQTLLHKMGTFPAGIILHSFAGPSELVRSLVKQGAYFSFSGHNTCIKREKAQRVWREVPLDRILLETDCPDGLPRVDPSNLIWVPGDEAAPSHGNDDCRSEQACCSAEDDDNPRGSTNSEEHRQPADERKNGKVGKGALNQPANIRANLSFIASLLAVPEQELAEVAYENAKRLFSFPGSKLLELGRHHTT